MIARRLLPAWLATFAPCCTTQPPPSPDVAPPAESLSAQPRAPLERSAGTRVNIGAAEFRAGTPPGTTRLPALEPTPFVVRLGPFAIDTYAFPNDPAQVPQRATREVAARQCAERGGRLCTELEWERACRGPANTPFASGDAWRPECADPYACASGFAVFGQGSLPEWTSNTFAGESDVRGKPVVRGALEPGEQLHHCSRRASAPNADAELAFRCCYGAPNSERVQEPQAGAVFEKLNLPPSALTELLASHELTRALAAELTLFSEPEAVNTVIARGPGNRMGFDFTTSALLWRPELGAEYVVLSGKSGKDTSFVLAYHHQSDGAHVLAASFVMRDEPGPVVLAYSPSIRPRLHFSSCWGCPGENGKILFRPPDTVVILQP